MLCSLGLRIVLSGWLAVLGWQDVKRREVSHWLTTVPLIGIAGWKTVSATVRWCASGGWSAGVADGLAVGLAFVAVLLSDSWTMTLPALAGAALAFGAGSLAGQTVVATWLIWLAFSLVGIVGPGDAKVVMVLVGLVPDWRLVACICGVAVLVGGACMIRNVGAAAPFLALSCAKDLIRRLCLPADGEGREIATTGGTALPLVPVLGAGAVLYLWLLWIVGVS